ncbi:MAG: T9SS type A sorting domain-containing protein [Bacteroidota bacterium]
MKKIYLALSFLAVSSVSMAQNISIDFQDDAWYVNNVLHQYPSQITGDTMWYSTDNDGFPDANARPGDWFLLYAFAVADSITGTGDTNVALGSSSWHSTVAISDNWFITRFFVPSSATMLTWKSATRQTPLYLDGYKVKISTGTNDLADFTTTLFSAAEFVTTTGANNNDFATYTFAPNGAWVQGWNGTAIVPTEIEDSGDSSRWIGILTTKSVSLASYVGQDVYIGFHHTTEDDNLISIDDILINNVSFNGVEEIALDLGVKAYPNPTADFINVSFNLNFDSPVFIDVRDVEGRLVKTVSMGVKGQGSYTQQINVNDIANGTYNVFIKTSKGTSHYSFIKN